MVGPADAPRRIARPKRAQDGTRLASLATASALEPEHRLGDAGHRALIGEEPAREPEAKPAPETQPEPEAKPQPRAAEPPACPEGMQPDAQGVCAAP